MYLQVPLAHGRTSVPARPEFHEDNALVFFHFGWDLTDVLRAAGFAARVLIPVGYWEMLRGSRAFPPSEGEWFDQAALTAAVRFDELEVVMNDAQAALLGIQPQCHFSTWEAVRLTNS